MYPYYSRRRYRRHGCLTVIMLWVGGLTLAIIIGGTLARACGNVPPAYDRPPASTVTAAP
jgi:hypothetical protein